MAHCATRVRRAALALVFVIADAACERGDGPDDVGDHADDTQPTDDSSGPPTGDTTAMHTDASQTESSGPGPDRGAIEQACQDSCQLAITCDPDEIPTYYDSLEDCVSGCIERTELYFADGCGPVNLARLVCWAGLTCEEWLAYVETGFSPCGDAPGTMWCDD
jgi:hypothetical protein